MNRDRIKILLNSTIFTCNVPINSKPFLYHFIPQSPYSFSSSDLDIISNPSSKSLSNPLYHLLPRTQNPNNIVNIIYSFLKQDNTQLAILQNDIKGLLAHLGTNEISRVLLRCQSDSISALAFFNWVKNDLDIKPSTHNYCLLVHILACSREFKQAMKFLTELIRLVKDCASSEDVFQSLVLCCEDCNWDPVIFDMLIKAYVKEGLIKEGFSTFMKIVEVGYVPSVVACNSVLNGLLKLNCIDLCWQVYIEMGKVGIHPNSYTFNILTHVFCRDGDVTKVNDFLEKMEEEGFEPDIVTYNTLISCYCRKGRLNDAFYLYRIMYRRRVLPDLVSYTALMSGLCKEGRLRDAHQLFHRMVHRGLNPDIVSFNTLICGYCKEGKIRELRLLLHEMIGSGIRPDNVTCRVLVEGYAKQGRIVSALNLVVELERFGVPISWDIYDYLIVSLCKEDKPFAAKNLLERICQQGYVPGAEICNELIQSFCKSDCVADALLLKAEMVHRNLKPNVTGYKALLCCLCRMSRRREVESLMEEMLQSDMLPDPEICRALTHMYCKERDFGKAESLLEFFAKEFQIFDTESYNTLVKISCEDGDFTKLLYLQDRMLKVGVTPNGLTFKHMIHGLSKSMSLDKDKLLVE
ncbi:hypothetical protein JCGZ_10269 [Jatropha curcas]|uniref:Pentacotripeptide-repeat region of PRORP domain-containing protein n=1 Tax=Jatropha curcas TaxID=180498 RepID=A0A067LPH7_JATCU|nr:pentatricopeptide repeat-containing protein At5g40400 [Jatropha curcas]KDP46429.1 hypothetical protein JCGZ_10269 [Jatropha curcas]